MSTETSVAATFMACRITSVMAADFPTIVSNVGELAVVALDVFFFCSDAMASIARLTIGIILQLSSPLTM